MAASAFPVFGIRAMGMGMSMSMEVVILDKDIQLEGETMYLVVGVRGFGAGRIQFISHEDMHVNWRAEHTGVWLRGENVLTMVARALQNDDTQTFLSRPDRAAVTVAAVETIFQRVMHM